MLKITFKDVSDRVVFEEKRERSSLMETLPSMAPVMVVEAFYRLVKNGLLDKEKVHSAEYSCAGYMSDTVVSRAQIDAIQEEIDKSPEISTAMERSLQHRNKHALPLRMDAETLKDRLKKHAKKPRRG